MQKVALLFLAAVFIGCNATIDETQCYEPPLGNPYNLYSLYRNCLKATDSRTTICMNAVDYYCSGVKYAFVDKRASSGIMRGVKADTNEIFLSCLWTTSKQAVGLHNLIGCNSITELQSKECLRAARKYCQIRHGNKAAGYIYATSSDRADWVHVACFDSVEQRSVSPRDLALHNSKCDDQSKSASSGCFNAASKWCEGKGHDGGITQGNDGPSITVACYKDTFHKFVKVKSARSQSSYYYRQYLAAKRRYEQAREFELPNEEEYGEKEGFKSDIGED